MYIAEKDNLRCRIPDRKVKDYEFMGYKCTELATEPKTDQRPKMSKQKSTEA